MEKVSESPCFKYFEHYNKYNSKAFFITMHRFNNPFAENRSKTLLWRVYPKTTVTKNLNTKTSTTVKHFL